MAFDDFKDILAAIATEWNAAEFDIKLGEQVNRKVVFPAIKELRYAGRRLADALVLISQGGDEDSVRELLIDARFNCHCARHDVIDAATLKMAIDMDLMFEKLGHEAALFAFPKFPQLYQSIQDAQVMIAAAREKRENRQEIYAEIEAARFKDLVQMFNELKASEPLMKRIAVATKTSRWTAYGLAIVAIAIALLSWLFPRSL
jgi:hypothetical protein